MSRIFGVGLAVAIAVAVVSQANAAVVLNGAGATFPQPLYTKWFYEYHKLHPNVQVNYQGIGSGGGIRAVKQQTVDFGASDAPVSDKELATFPVPIFQIPTVGGAVAVVYNLPGVANLRLTPSLLAGIFLGYITKWSDSRLQSGNPGVNLPNRPIVVCHRSDGSGTTYLFTSYLAAISPAWKLRVGVGKSVNWPVGKGGKGNPGVAGLVKNIPGAIGYVELAYAIQNRLSTVALQNRSGKFVKPTLEATTACIAGAADALRRDPRTPIVNAPGAKAYPIVGLTFLLVYKHYSDAVKGHAIVDLLRWCMGPGQKMAPSLHYAPLPKPVIQANLAVINKIRLGQ